MWGHRSWLLGGRYVFEILKYSWKENLLVPQNVLKPPPNVTQKKIVLKLSQKQKSILIYFFYRIIYIIYWIMQEIMHNGPYTTVKL